MGKLTGISMGCDACYTNHAIADQNDQENLEMLLAAAGVNYLMGIPMGDDVMLNYQTTSFTTTRPCARSSVTDPRRSSRRGWSAWACGATAS